MAYDIPSEAYIGFLDQTFEIHWDNHALLMFGVWFALVPTVLLVIRFGKPPPTPYGIPRGTGKLDRKLIWWTLHYFGLYTAIVLSLAGVAIAVTLSGGFSGTLHSAFGLATVAFGCLQIASAWLRGSHGGKHGQHSDPDDPTTWGGDHFDMTPHRRWFEAYHKTGGYFTITLALGAVATGLSQFWMPMIAVALGVVIVVVLAAAVLLQASGFYNDTYSSVYGNHPDHPFNKKRKGPR
jgi:hypothetical protein